MQILKADLARIGQAGCDAELRPTVAESPNI